MKLYEKLADKIEGLVHKGTYRCGDRLPSVRAQSKTSKVSISTVVEAYRLLEDRGLIEVRPQSGYYVRQAQSVSEPPRVEGFEAPIEVSVSELILNVVEDMGKTEVQMGRPIRTLLFSQPRVSIAFSAVFSKRTKLLSRPTTLRLAVKL